MRQKSRYSIQGLIFIWVLLLVALLSSMILFGLESIGRLEQVIALEQVRGDKTAQILKQIQEQGAVCHSSGRLIGFAANTVAVGEVNGRYYYEFPVQASEADEGWWRVVVSRWAIMDAVGQGRFICYR